MSPACGWGPRPPVSTANTPLTAPSRRTTSRARRSSGRSPRWRGERLQTPPLYSAKKIEGTRAYEFARAGETVEMRQSLVTIHGIELLECRLPDLTIRVRCSKGTYIRSLAREIGEALDSGAYLTSLRRTRSGSHTVDGAWQLDDFLKKLRAE